MPSKLPSNYKAVAKAHRTIGGSGGKCSCRCCRAVRREAKEKRLAKRNEKTPVERRAEAAERLLTEWEGKAAFALGKVRKYRKRVAYYRKLERERWAELAAAKATAGRAFTFTDGG